MKMAMLFRLILFTFLIGWTAIGWTQSGYDPVNNTWTDQFTGTSWIDWELFNPDNIVVDTTGTGRVLLAPGQAGQLLDGSNDPGRRFQDRVDVGQSQNIVFLDDTVQGGDYLMLTHTGAYYEEFLTQTYRSPLTTATWDTTGRGELRVPEDERWFLESEDPDFGFRLRDVWFSDANNGWIVGYGGQVWKTTNQGKTWLEVSDPGNNGTDYNAVFFADENHGWIVAEAGYAWQTTNGGVNWTQMQTPQYFGNRDLKDVWYRTVDGGYDGWIVGSNGRIWHQLPSGEWHEHVVDTVESTLNKIFFRGSGTDEAGFIVGDYSTYLEFNFAQDEWVVPQSTGLVSGEIFRSIFYVDTDIGWIVGTNGTVLRTRNGGSSWTNHAPEGIENLDVTDIRFVTRDVGYLVTRTGRIYKTTNGTAIDQSVNWQYQEVYLTDGQVDPSFSKDIHSVCFPSPGNGWAVGEREIRLHNPIYHANTEFVAISHKINNTYFNPELNIRSVTFDAGYEFTGCEEEDCFIQASISVDGGTSWIDVDPGDQISIQAQGHDLHWRIRIRTADSNVTPRVDWLSLHYSTDYDMVNDGIYTSLPEDTDSVTGFGEKNKSFTNIQWLTGYDENTAITMEYKVDDGDWIAAPADDDPVFEAGTLLYTHTMPNTTFGKVLRYRATLHTDDPARSPRLYEVRQGFGFVPSGNLKSDVISKLNPDAYWTELAVSRTAAGGSSINFDILDANGTAELVSNIGGTVYSFASGQDWIAALESLRLNVDLMSNPSRTTSPILDLWRLRWELEPIDGYIYFATQIGDQLFPKVYVGDEDVFVKLEDADRNVSTLTRDVIPASDVTLVVQKEDRTIRDSESISLLEISQNAGVFTNAPGNGVPMEVDSTGVSNNGILTVLPQDSVWVYYDDGAGDTDDDVAYVRYATGSDLYFRDATFTLIKDVYKIGKELIFIEVIDPDENKNPNINETVLVTLTNSDVFPEDMEVIVCTEINDTLGVANTGIFRSSGIPSTCFSNIAQDDSIYAECIIQADAANEIRASYRDPDLVPADSTSKTADLLADPEEPPPTQIDGSFADLIIAPNPHYTDDDNLIIRFSINPDTFLGADVHIYNIAGEWIDDVSNEEFVDSTHPDDLTIHTRRGEWDLTNHNGKDITSGTYFLHVIGRDTAHGKKEQTIKLVVILKDRP